jgi:hypothetical protein
MLVKILLTPLLHQQLMGIMLLGVERLGEYFLAHTPQLQEPHISQEQVL